MGATMPNKIWLPEKFESLETARGFRKKAVAATTRLPKPFATELKLTECTQFARCGSGLCPVCVRILRRKFLLFLHREKLSHLKWLSVTVRVSGWTKYPGDLAPFGPYRDRADVKALLDRLRRNGDGNAVAFGSIETFFKTVANEPVGKPFHLHLLTSGIPHKEVEKAIKKTFDLDQLAVFPVVIKSVKDSLGDFVKTASYVFAQPYWKSSYPDSDSRHGRGVFPQPHELAELIANLGAHPVGDRLILMGIRRDGSKFHLTKSASADG
jgi:hypothetical protein